MARDAVEVEDLPCPAREGLLHELTNDKRARTHCRHCLASWAELDAAAREAAGPPKRQQHRGRRPQVSGHRTMP